LAAVERVDKWFEGDGELAVVHNVLL
jgi:hypothetical protein